MNSNMNSRISASNNNNPPVQQHVSKASSDELLRKFAQVVSQADIKKELQLANKRRRKINTTEDDQARRASWPDQQCALLPNRKKRQRGIIVRERSRNSFKSKYSILRTFHMTWRRTVEGASKVLLEKHYYNRHKRLINDSIY